MYVALCCRGLAVCHWQMTLHCRNVTICHRHVALGCQSVTDIWNCCRGVVACHCIWRLTVEVPLCVTNIWHWSVAICDGQVALGCQSMTLLYRCLAACLRPYCISVPACHWQMTIHHKSAPIYVCHTHMTLCHGEHTGIIVIIKILIEPLPSRD